VDGQSLWNSRTALTISGLCQYRERCAAPFL
jgi:hypothetical protein